MKKILLTIVGIMVCAGLFTYVYQNYQKHPKADATTVSLEQYKELEKHLESAQNTIAAKEKSSSFESTLLSQEVDRVTAQRNQLCTQYKNVRPAPTTALCQ